MLHHLFHYGAISVGTGGAMITIIGRFSKWTKVYKNLPEAIEDAEKTGLMEHAKPVSPTLNLGMAYSLELPPGFDHVVLSAAGFVEHGQGTAPNIP